MERYYKVWNNDYTFYVRVYEEKHDIEISVGSKDFPQCVLFTVTKNSANAELLDALYNELCASNIPMPAQHGTLQMLEMSLKFITQMYPYVKRIDLSDNSYINCTDEVDPSYDEKQKTHINLADMYVLAYGGTWYQLRFGAKPLFINYDELLHNLNNSIPSSVLTFDLFWERYCTENGRQSEWLQQEKSVYEYIYNSADSWKTFFSTVYEQEKCVPFIAWCKHTNRILELICDHFSTLKGTLWYITPQIIETYPTECQIEEVSQIPIRSWKGGRVRRNPNANMNRMGFHKNDV